MTSRPKLATTSWQAAACCLIRCGPVNACHAAHAAPAKVDLLEEAAAASARPLAAAGRLRVYHDIDVAGSNL